MPNDYPYQYENPNPAYKVINQMQNEFKFGAFSGQTIGGVNGVNFAETDAGRENSTLNTLGVTEKAASTAKGVANLVGKGGGGLSAALGTAVPALSLGTAAVSILQEQKAIRDQEKKAQRASDFQKRSLISNANKASAAARAPRFHALPYGASSSKNYS
jgi:hypothetical protein